MLMYVVNQEQLIINFTVGLGQPADRDQEVFVADFLNSKEVQRISQFLIRKVCFYNI